LLRGCVLLVEEDGGEWEVYAGLTHGNGRVLGVDGRIESRFSNGAGVIRLFENEARGPGGEKAYGTYPW